MDLSEYRKEIDRIDTEMAKLFEERMKVSAGIAAYKKENGLPVYDPEREKANLMKAGERVSEGMQDYYRAFLQKLMDLSKEYQKEIL